MASLPCLFAHPGTSLHVMLGGEARPATVLPGTAALYWFLTAGQVLILLYYQAFFTNSTQQGGTTIVQQSVHSY